MAAVIRIIILLLNLRNPTLNLTHDSNSWDFVAFYTKFMKNIFPLTAAGKTSYTLILNLKYKIITTSSLVFIRQFQTFLSTGSRNCE